MSLKRNTIANYIGQFYNMFIGIAILPAYMTYLGSEAFGLIGFFTMLSSWMMLLDMGLSATISRESAHLKHQHNGLMEFRKILRSIEALFFPIAITIAFVVWQGDNWIASHWLHVESLDINEVAYCIALMGGMIGLKWVVGLYKGALNGFEYQVWLNTYGIIINTLKFVGGFVLVKYISHEPESYFEYQLVVALLEFFVIHKKVYSLLPKSSGIMVPSLSKLKKVMPFALSVAYTSALWIALTQVDKLLLSNLLPLKEYGYFSLVAVVASGMMALSSPIGTAIRPRMTALVSQNKIKEMEALYKKGTQFVSVIGFAVSGTVAVYSKELLYAWTGNMEAATWASPILFWYALGNGALMVLSFQYFLQFAYGNLKYHVRINTYFGIVQIIAMVWAVYTYGAIGAAITWFILQILFFLLWPAYIHSKFASGLHRNWMLKDVLPVVLSSFTVLMVMYSLNINFFKYDRLEIFLILGLIGMLILVVNAMVASDVRRLVVKRALRQC